MYSYRRQARSSRSYRFPRRYGSSYRSRGRTYRGYGSYGLLAAAAPYALRAIPYIYRGYKAYQKGGTSGLRRYAGRLATSAAKGAIKAVTGYGAYSRIGRGGMQGTQAPSIRNGSLDGGSIIISHKEYIGDVTSGPNVASVPFKIDTFRINPGDEKTFPWLSQLAKNFQQYRLRGLCFHYKSMSADALNSTNTALGQVILSTNYDATQQDPTSKNEMENMEYAQSIKPSQSTTHFIECAKSQSTLTELYVNENPTSQAGDTRFYDFGKFHIATNGMQASNVNLGELWVSYEVQLYKPQLWDALGKDVNIFGWSSTDPNVEITDTTPLGTDDWAKGVTENSVYFDNNTMQVYSKIDSGVLFKPFSNPKCFLIEYTVTGSPNQNINLEANFAPLNCALVTGLLDDVNPYSMFSTPNAGTSTPSSTMKVTVKYDGTNIGKPWGFEWSVSPNTFATVTYANLIVTEYPYTTA